MNINKRTLHGRLEVTGNNLVPSAEERSIGASGAEKSIADAGSLFNGVIEISLTYKAQMTKGGESPIPS